MVDSEHAAALQVAVREFSRFRERLLHLPAGEWHAMIFSNDRFDVVATPWLPGKVTSIHDHGVSACWVFVAEGRLELETFAREDKGDRTTVTIRSTGKAVLRTGEMHHCAGPRTFHRICNTTDVPAFTLQVYVPPIFAHASLNEETMQLSLDAYRRGCTFEDVARQIGATL